MSKQQKASEPETDAERRLTENAKVDGRWWADAMRAPPAGSPPASHLQPASRAQSRVLAAYADFRALFAPGQFTGDDSDDAFAERVTRALQALCDALATMRYDESQSDTCKHDTAILAYDACCKLTAEVHFPASLMRFLFRRYVLFPLNLLPLEDEEAVADDGEDEEVSVARLKTLTKDAVVAAKNLLSLWGFFRPNGGWLVEILTEAGDPTTSLCDKLAEFRDVGLIDDEFALALRSCIHQANLVDMATKVRLVGALEIVDDGAFAEAQAGQEAEPLQEEEEEEAVGVPVVAEAAPATEVNDEEIPDRMNVSQTAVLDEASNGFSWNDSLFNGFAESASSSTRQRGRSVLLPVRTAEDNSRGSEFTGGCAFDPSRPATSSCSDAAEEVAQAESVQPVAEQDHSEAEPQDAGAEDEQQQQEPEQAEEAEAEMGPEGDASSLAAILANLDQDLQRRLQQNRPR
jgi:hypothetical protein